MEVYMWEIVIICLSILILGMLIYLIFRGNKDRAADLENTLSRVWTKMELGEKIALISDQAKEIQKNQRSFEQMLRTPGERGHFGEISLETILSDQLPPSMFGVQKVVLGGKKPDAYIESTVGIICIDSKFPLDNYRKLIESEDEKEKSNFKKLFKDDVEKQLVKIAADYVCPEKGSAEFALAYIPVESVAYYLITEESDMLLKMIKRGVQVVSPLTLSQRVELIKAGVHAKHLSENAEQIKKEILRLASAFDKVNDAWKTLYETHIKNLTSKADEVNTTYKKLKDEFDNIKNKGIEE